MWARLPLLILGALASGALACAVGARDVTRTPRSSDVRADLQGDRTDLGAVALVDVDGHAAVFRDVLARRPALVSFWAPWCEPCVRELPELERLSRAVSPCGAAVVGVAVGEKPAAIAAFARARRLGYAQLTDEPFALADALGQRRIPATVVFDGAGRVVFTGDALDARATSALARTVGDPAKRCAWP